MRKLVAPIAALIVLALLAVGGLWLVRALTNQDSYYGCDRYTRAIDATEGLIAQTPPGAPRDELEEHVKQLADLRQQAEDDGCGVKDPEPTTTPSPTPTPTPSASAAEPEPEAQPAASDSWEPHYYTLDQGKTGARNFGPPVKGGQEAAAGDAAAIASINAEFKEHMLRDPALLCGNGGLVLNAKDGGKPCVDALLASKSARDAYHTKVFDNVASTRVEQRSAQYVESAYMVVPTDGVPRIVKVNVSRPSTYYVLVVETKDGKSYSFRLECGFQWDTGRKVVPRTYTPVAHAPYTSVKPCVNGGERNEHGRCVVPPKETTPPGETSTPTPTDTPEPTPTPTPTPEAKDPSEDPAPRGNAGNGGGRNQDPGPGAVTTPSPAPATPRVNPAPPAPAPEPSTDPAPAPEQGAPTEDDPANGTVEDP